MFQLIDRLFRGESGCTYRRRSPQSRRWRLQLERLEDRTLLDGTTFALPSILAALNGGTNLIRSRATDIARSAFVPDLPLLDDSLSTLLDLTSPIAGAFPKSIDVGSTLEDARGALTAAGFTVERLELKSDAAGDLVRLRYTFQLPMAARTISFGGTTGFSYFDNWGVQLAAIGMASVQPITFQVTFGIDVVNDQPSFFLHDSTHPSSPSLLNVPGVSASATLNLSFGLGWLLDANLNGTVAANLSAKLTLRDSDTDHKLRTSDIQGPQAFVGDIDGTVGLTSASFTARNPLLGDIAWTGRFVADFTEMPETGPSIDSSPRLDVTVGPTGTDVTTYVTGLLRNLAGNFFNITNVFAGGDSGFLGNIRGYLTTQLPLYNKTLADVLGISSHLDWLWNRPESTSYGGQTIPQIKSALNRLGIEVPLADNPSLVQNLIRGERVDLIRFHKSGGQQWSVGDVNIFIGTVPLPPIGSINFNLFARPYLGWNYNVGLGIDTSGFWIDPATRISIGGGLEVGLKGSAALFGFFNFAEVSVSASLDVSAGISLRDPDPSDGKIYLDEIFHHLSSEGAGLASIGQFLKGDLRVDVNGHARVKLDLPWPLPDLTFSKSIQIDQWMVPEPARPTSTPRPRPNAELPLASGLAQVVGGVLVLNGTPGADRVVLDQSGGTVNVAWFGKGKGSFTGVQRVRFEGREGNDTLRVKDGFNLPIEAFGGAGDDYLEGGSADDLLEGGADNDFLEGRAGADTLRGGSGADQLRGGAGADVLYGDDGDDQLFGDDGADTLYGGLGNDQLDGGLNNDRLLGEAGNDNLRGGGGNDYLEGGAGMDQLHGEGGNDTLLGGAEKDFLAGGAGDDLLYGGDDDDVLQGDEGRDILYGEAGADRLTGGIGDDVLDGGTGDDILQGDHGADTLLGGDGNDQLFGGDGSDRLFGGEGDDRLNGGRDTDQIFGEGGDDTIEFDFDTVSGVIPDTLRGGIGRDSIIISGRDALVDSQGHTIAGSVVDDHIGLMQRQVAPLLFEYTATQYGPTGQPTGTIIFTLSGGLDNDIEIIGMTGLKGNDRLIVDPSVQRDVVLFGGDGNDELQGGGGRDILWGGDGDDTLKGGADNDELHGEGGRDQLFGEGGNDVLYGGDEVDGMGMDAPGDTLDGGPGRDVLYGERGHDTLIAGPGLLGDVMFGGTGNDTLVGGNGIDVLSGDDGNDTISGGAQGDVLIGGAGNDILRGQAGADVLLGMAGNDTLYAEDGPAPVITVSWLTILAQYDARRRELLVALTDVETRLNAVEAQLSAVQADLTAVEAELARLVRGTDEYAARESEKNNLVALRQSLTVQRQVLLSERGALVDERIILNLTENEFLRPYQSMGILVDILEGGAGNDTLYGSDYPDFLIGGEGNDTIVHSLGHDTIVGGSGEDTYLLLGTDNRDVIEVVGTPAGGGNYNVEVFVGEGTSRQRLVQSWRVLDIEKFKVDGRGGNDEIRVAFRSQAPGITSSPAIVSIEIDGGDGNDLIDCFTGGLEANAILRGGPGNDTIIGGQGNDDIDGGADNDLLIFSPGNDTIIGGGGDDTFLVRGTDGDDYMNVRYAETPPGTPRVLSVFSSDSATALPVGRLVQLIGIQHFRMEGLGGNDTLSLVATLGTSDFAVFADITIEGGDGNDWLDASTNLPIGVTIRAGSGNDTMYGSNLWNDRLEGGDGDDWLYGMGGNDLLEGGAGNDRLDGGPGNDMLFGGEGDDTLDGGAGIDALRGEAGNDRLYFSDVSDLYDGGIGPDDRLIVVSPAVDATLVVFEEEIIISGQRRAFSAGFNFEGYELETRGLPSTIRYGVPGQSPDPSGPTFTRKPLYKDGQPIETFTTFQITGAARPSRFAVGPGGIWFAVFGADHESETDANNGIRRIDPNTGMTTTVASMLPAGSHALTLGPDGNMWATDNNVFRNRIFRITAAGTVTPLNNTPFAVGNLVAGRPGSTHLWASQYSGNRLARIETQPTLSVTEVPLPAEIRDITREILGLIEDANGNLWMSLKVTADGSVGRIAWRTPTGTVNLLPMATTGIPLSLTFGPDGNIWWTTTRLAPRIKIGRINVTQMPVTLQEFDVPTSFVGDASHITRGPDGNLWLAEAPGNRIWRVTPDLVFRSFPIGSGTGAELADIVTGPDGNLWFGDSVPSPRRVLRFIPPRAASLRVTAPTTVTAGVPFMVTVTAIDATNNTDSTAYAYRGTVRFTSSDLSAVLPASYTFTATDRGVHSFTVTLRTAGAPSFSVEDTVVSTIKSIRSTISEFPLPLPSTAEPTKIIKDRNGKLWITEPGAARVLQLSTSGIVERTFNLPLATASDPEAIVEGPDGDLWIALYRNHRIGRITPTAPDGSDGNLRLYGHPDIRAIYGITVGPDNKIWFTARNSTHIGRIDPNDPTRRVELFDPYVVPAAINYKEPASIVSGPDGNLWYTFIDGNAIGRINTSGTGQQVFPLPAPNSFPEGIAVGPDGNLWFAETSGNKIGRMTPSGVFTEFPLPNAASEPLDIVRSGDYLWFTERRGSRIGRIDRGGTIVEFTLPTANSRPYGITVDTDGNIWFAETTANQIGRLVLNPGINVVSASVAGLRITPVTTNPAVAGSPYSFTVAAIDAFGNVAPSYRGTVSFTTTDADATLPGPYTFSAEDNGQKTFVITLRRASGSQIITARDSEVASLTTDRSVIVRAAAASRFTVAAVASTQAGAAFSVTVTALDSFSNIATGYLGQVVFSSSDTQATFPIDYVFTAADQGVHQFTPGVGDETGVTLRTAGNRVISVRDRRDLTIQGSATVSVTPAAMHHFNVAGYRTALQAGLPSTFVVTAQDEFGNTVPSYARTVHLSSDDPQAELEEDYTFVAATDRGSHVFVGTLKTAGARLTITATDTAIIAFAGSQSNIQILPAPANRFLVTGFPFLGDGPATVRAGVEGQFTVTALDPYGNIDVFYVRTISFSSSDPQWAPPTDDGRFAISDRGRRTFRATLKTAGVQSISVNQGALTGSQESIAVTPAAAVRLRIDAPAAVTSGVRFDITVTALDAFGNIDTNYDGTVTFLVTDPDSGVMLPMAYTFSTGEEGDNGVHTFAAETSLVSLGQRIITVLDENSLLGTIDIAVLPRD